MEPENNQAEGRLAPLKKITPASKYLALVLFITMPFIGGWIGYTYGPEKVVEVERVVIQTNESTNSSDWTLSKPDKVVSPREELSRAQYLKQDYEKRTGQTYEVSSTSVRIIDSATDELVTLSNLIIPSELTGLTELPYLTIIGTITEGFVLSQHCFADKACGLSGLYKYNVANKTLDEMFISDFFDVVFRASVVSPDKTKIISSDLRYDGTEPNNLFLLDLKTDTYITLDTIPVGEGRFCSGGVGGCADIAVEWLGENRVKIKIYKIGKETEVRVYSLDL